MLIHNEGGWVHVKNGGTFIEQRGESGGKGAAGQGRWWNEMDIIILGTCMTAHVVQCYIMYNQRNEMLYCNFVL